MDADVDWRTVSLFTLDTFNVDNVFLTINLHHFADLLALVVSTHDLKEFNNMSDKFTPGMIFLVVLWLIHTAQYREGTGDGTGTGLAQWHMSKTSVGISKWYYTFH